MKYKIKYLEKEDSWGIARSDSDDDSWWDGYTEGEAKSVISGKLTIDEATFERDVRRDEPEFWLRRDGVRFYIYHSPIGVPAQIEFIMKRCRMGLILTHEDVAKLKQFIQKQVELLELECAGGNNITFYWKSDRCVIEGDGRWHVPDEMRFTLTVDEVDRLRRVFVVN